jgi:hypothetical protein
MVMDVATARCRCGYELRGEWARCPSCRRRLRRIEAPAPWASGRVGPEAAAAWERWHDGRAAAPAAVVDSVAADLQSYRDAAPAAARAGAALVVTRLVLAALAALHAVRLALALAAADRFELAANDGWSRLERVAGVTGTIGLVSVAAAAVLVGLWAGDAVPNLGALHLRASLRAPLRFAAGAAALGAAAAVLARSAWGSGALGPDRAGAATALAAAAAGAVIAHVVRAAVAAITVKEARRADELAHIVAAQRR